MSVTATKTNVPSGAIGRLKTQVDFLPPSLRRVAEHVLGHADTVVYQTITELAETAGVGEATVTRLCRRLGFAGFHAFKIALASDLASADDRELPTGTGVGELALLAARQASLAIEETRRIIDQPAVERVALAMAAAPRLDITGQGNSGFAAQFFAHKLTRLGLVAISHTDPHLASVSAVTLPRGGVLIGITRSGSTIDTVQNLGVARGVGAFTVAITNRASSPATKHANEVLYTASPEGPLAGGAISSLTSQVFLLEVLYLALVKVLPDASEIIRKTAESVVEKKF